MKALFKNQVSIQLKETITSSVTDTELYLDSTRQLPNIIDIGAMFYMLLVSKAGDQEIVKAVSVNTGNNSVTIERGAVRKPFIAGDAWAEVIVADTTWESFTKNNSKEALDVTEMSIGTSLDVDHLNILGSDLYVSGGDLYWKDTDLSISTGQAGLSMPIGSIIMFAGNPQDIPNNWKICDGKTYGSITTPNLIGEFVSCGATAGATAGKNSISIGGAGGHDHGTISTLSTTWDSSGDTTTSSDSITVAQMPSHAHTLPYTFAVQDDVYGKIGGMMSLGDTAFTIFIGDYPKIEDVRTVKMGQNYPLIPHHTAGDGWWWKGAAFVAECSGYTGNLFGPKTIYHHPFY